MLITSEKRSEKIIKTAKLLEDNEIEQALKVANGLSNYRLAKILREQKRDIILTVLEVMDSYQAAKVVSWLPEEILADLILELEENKVKEILVKLSSDKIVDLLAELEKDWHDKVLTFLSEETRELVQSLASYPEETVGSAMKTSFLAVNESTKVSEATELLTELEDEIEHSDYIYVVDEAEKLLGVISIKELISANKEKRVDEIMKKNAIAVSDLDDVEDAATSLKARHLKMLPVINQGGKLVGVLTMNIALNILSSELTEDLVTISGASAEESFFTPAMSAVKMRLPWMASNIFLNLIAVTIISSFEETIAQVAILAAFLPMITDMGGNVGIQALSVSIRSIALGEVQLRDFWRAIRKELAVGLFNGAALGLIFSLIAFALEGNPILGIIAGTALGINVLLAGMVGGTLPFIIKHFGKDPALMTGPLLTTITDVTGVSVYLGLSTLFLTALL